MTPRFPTRFTLFAACLALACQAPAAEDLHEEAMAFEPHIMASSEMVQDNSEEVDRLVQEIEGTAVPVSMEGTSTQSMQISSHCWS